MSVLQIMPVVEVIRGSERRVLPVLAVVWADTACAGSIFGGVLWILPVLAVFRSFVLLTLRVLALLNTLNTLELRVSSTLFHY